MRFASLGSGSRGNATLVGVGQTLLLVDCGFSVKQVEKRLARLDKSIEALSAILVTHEHTDHIGGVVPLARRYNIPVYLTPGTARYDKIADLAEPCFFNSHEKFSIGAIEIQPFPVPHDASEPSQFVFSDGAKRLGMLTDVGCWTAHIEAQLTACDALILESNHDVAMLAKSSYPAFLKRRVGGEQGHLSNDQAAQLLKRLDNSKLQHIVAAHLSEPNNTADLARQALSQALGCGPDWINVANQADGLAWREII